MHAYRAQRCQFRTKQTVRRHDEGVILVYDGECGFCIRSARWIEARLPAGVGVEPWQSLDLEELGLSEQEAQAAVWWIEGHGTSSRRARGAEAIGRSLLAAGGVWKLVGMLISRPPLLWLARPVYTLVAANRHRLGGRGTDSL